MLERIELEAFLTLAEQLHFGRTAERLYVSTARISQAIKKLERQIGAPLFDRTSRKVALTPLGQQLYEEMRPAAHQLDSALQRATDTARGITGALRVGYSAPWCGDLVVRAADDFVSSHPDCEVLVQEVQFSDPFGPLRDRQLDLQLNELPVEEPDITTGPVILAERRALIVPARHPLAGQDSVSVDDLADETWVTVAGRSPYWLDHYLPSQTPAGRPITRGPSVTYWQEVFPRIAAGHGITPTAWRSVEHQAHPGVAFVPFRDAPPIEYGLIWIRDTPLIRAYTDTLRITAGWQPSAPSP